MSAALDVVVEAGDWGRLGDAESWARRAVEAALAVADDEDDVQVAILLADDAQVQILNRDWRGLDKPTNVLSFPSSLPVREAEPRHLGDIALAFETLVREAEAEGKSLADHATHLIVHGVLHLLDYDHETDADAEAMEALEIEALARIGVADPYRDLAA